ncbi:MAG: hypothetical protein A3C58_03790 [Candidatus Staskawiczbacteria bacterium RIFCSPHIGHO2_02_FULL_34_10]|uniref:Response regulatory domain-containing protein n=1 Tax=Candidatus Staskawiczbacteria bacterium RIFCSPHIGHO2_02_FULL_34_10 TaxID=1802205 RepID=A0A1G2HXV2_9BACT|nr:MAG: hypothetical protein A3C58_03790 [Candidatus Staskawiczbacteria bacterium RIFCSPHIGHO2_02_FULL_34_10]
MKKDKNKKILIVEDDVAIVDIYKTILEKASFAVDVISSGQEVIKTLKDIKSEGEVKPDLILLDLILPDMNGIEVLKELKGNSATKDIKVFILTNQEIELQDLGGIRPDKYIIKANITPTQLLEVIKKQLD